MKLFDRFRPEPSGPTQEESLMFEMQQIGRRIAASRKQLDMTQQDLADQLGVTYQAVSNWERGLSIPDVLRLKDLAKLFKISLDELMGNEADVRILEVASGERKPDSLAELASSAPYMKPSALEKELLDQAGASSNDQAGIVANDPAGTQTASPPTTDEASPSRPAVPLARPAGPPTQPAVPSSPTPLAASTTDEKTMEKKSTVERTDGSDTRKEAPASSDDQTGSTSRITPEELMAMAPFVSPEVLTKVVKHLIATSAKFPAEQLSALAPFLEPDQLTDLVTTALNNKLNVTDELIASLAPFLDSEDLELILTSALKESALSPRILMMLAPFLESDHLDGIIAHFTDKNIPIPQEVILALAPFLEGETISRLINSMENLTSGMVQALLPFADEGELDSMILRSFGLDQ